MRSHYMAYGGDEQRRLIAHYSPRDPPSPPPFSPSSNVGEQPPSQKRETGTPRFLPPTFFIRAHIYIH